MRACKRMPVNLLMGGSHEPFAYHHFNHNNVDVVAIPVDIHQLYNSTDSRKHREMLLPIVEQLYPEIKLFMKENKKES